MQLNDARQKELNMLFNIFKKKPKLARRKFLMDLTVTAAELGKWLALHPPIYSDSCTGCGDDIAIYKRTISPLCQFCMDSMQHELLIRKETNKGSAYFAVFAKPNDKFDDLMSIGAGSFQRTYSESFDYFKRVEKLNGWELLTINYQKTLKYVYVSESYKTYLPESNLTI